MGRRLTHRIGWVQESGNIKHDGGISVGKNNKCRVVCNLRFACDRADENERTNHYITRITKNYFGGVSYD